ncbi:methyl-accepting chemotaxis protein [Amphibacillus indicireducens]|uniref:Methyl-accepting chemotaxis protein n=1 Tax=Amphibacillus indicireducens TaxID=1076330 RepID=A0ABP7W4S9_9BACI
MFKWSNRNLTFKYGSIYVLIVILFVISALLINLLLSDTRDEVNVMNRSTENSVMLFEMELLIQERYSILGQYMVAPTDLSVSDFENTIAEFNAYLDEIDPYIDSDDKQYLLNTVLENDAEIIESFNEYTLLRESEKSANIDRRTYENARRNYQQSSFSLNQLRTIFEEERLNAVESTSESFQITTQIQIISILLSVFIGLTILILVNYNVKKRLTEILGFSEKIEQGHLSANNLDVHGTDEFSKISLSLNTMKDSIEDILKDISNVSINVGSKSDDLEKSATFLEHVSISVSNKLNELITIVEEQSASIIQISSTNDNFNERINSIEQFSAKMKSSSLEVSTETKEGISLMNVTASNIATINESVANTVSKVNILVERAVDISQITELINKVAEKTNLLALNASIEAARAGDYGKGFAVVADEIRDLSAEVNQSINDINVIIQGIQQDANEVKSVLKSSNEKTIIEQNKIQQNITSLHKVESSVNELVKNIDHIYADITTMTGESDEINISLDGLSKLSNKTTVHINDAHESIFEQSNIIKQMNDHSKDLSDAVGKLEGSMSRFTVAKEIKELTSMDNNTDVLDLTNVDKEVVEVDIEKEIDLIESINPELDKNSIADKVDGKVKI